MLIGMAVKLWLAKKCLYINYIKTLWWYWHIWSSHLSYVVIHWPTNPDVNHSLAELVQCNHQLVVLPYLKLPFQLATQLQLHSYNYPQTRDYPPGTMLHQPTFIKVSLGAGSSFVKVAGVLSVVWNTVLAQLFAWITQWSTSLLSIQLYITLSKYFDKLFVVKSLINTKQFSWKY